MLVGVMSDSHDNLEKVDKALKVFSEKGIELLIHLGDIISPFTLIKILEFFPRSIIVLGNNDGEKILLKELASKAGATLKNSVHELTLKQKKILLVHGFGGKQLTKRLIDSIASSNTYDIVLYGHTHEVDVRKVGKTLVLNPGEVLGYLSGKSTIALLDIEKMEVEIIEL
ncbi:MAG: hypothetical protein DRO18_05915 [Thermoprotei archaeon]|nr:MAG: hypothetical protein DRO18_05915 [Thermoprotei archaeon]